MNTHERESERVCEREDTQMGWGGRDEGRGSQRGRESERERTRPSAHLKEVVCVDRKREREQE
jgi:hypothetical protein